MGDGSPVRPRRGLTPHRAVRSTRASRGEVGTHSCCLLGTLALGGDSLLFKPHCPLKIGIERPDLRGRAGLNEMGTRAQDLLLFFCPSHTEPPLHPTPQPQREGPPQDKLPLF